MKKLYIASLVGIACVAGSAWSATETIDGYTWTYRINGDTAEIYKGNSVAISPRPTGLVTIPDNLGGKSVTSIGHYALYNCSGITWVTIPDCVTSIGERTFSGCSSLTSVAIPDSVTNIGERAFYNCSKLTIVTIGNGVTAISDRAFYGCKTLPSISIPDCVTTIGSQVFSNCKGLLSFAVAEDNPVYKSVSGLLLTKDGKTLVAGVNGDVIIPDGVTDIGRYAFYGCRKLTSIVIPGSVKSIEGGAFSGCTGLRSVTIPDGVVYIADDAFSGCSGLRVYYGGIVDDVLFGVAQTKRGALYDAANELVGTVELKFGKANARTGAARVAASATLMVDGKVRKVTAKPITIKEGDMDKPFVFRAPIGEMVFSMAPDGSFTLMNNDYKMVGAVSDGVTDTIPRVMSVGGTLAKEMMSFNVTVDVDVVPDFGKSGALLEEALPRNEPIYVSGGTKWTFGKIALLKYKRNRENGIFELTGLDDPAKPNLSGLKLVYTPKTGLFKGTFKLYATNAATVPEGQSPKLRRFVVNVVGFVVDGVGCGWATMGGQGILWPVRVE